MLVALRKIISLATLLLETVPLSWRFLKFKELGSDIYSCDFKNPITDFCYATEVFKKYNKHVK
jgi:hypothetical protein